MEHPGSLDELDTFFTEKIQLMTHTLLLRDVHKDTHDVKLMKNLNNSLSDLRIILYKMKMQLAQQREEVKQFEALKELMLAQKKDLQHAEENLPAKLPKLMPPVALVGEPNRPLEKAPSRQSAERCQPERNLKLKKGPYIRSMDYLTVEEFVEVPKYMKGRLTYDQINNVVDGFNAAISKKYEILYKPKSEQTEQIKKKIQAFKKQESKDTKGFYFVIEEDLGKLSSLKMDNVARSILTILRHTGRLKLIRGAGSVRYALA